MYVHMELPGESMHKGIFRWRGGQKAPLQAAPVLTANLSVHVHFDISYNILCSRGVLHN